MQPVFSCPFLAVVHCGAERSSWAVFRWRHGKLACLQGGEEVGARGEWLQTSAAAMRAARQATAGSAPLVLVLSAPLVLLKLVKAPRVAVAQRAKVIRFEIEQNLSSAASGVIWDFVTSGGSEATEDLLVAAAKSEVVAALCAAAQGANFKTRMILPSALTTLAADKLMRPASNDRLLVLNVGAGSATLLQIDGQAFAARSWLLGGEVRTPPQAPDEETMAGQLVHEVSRSLAYFQRQHELNAPTHVVLAGDAARIARLAELLRVKLQLPVQALEVAAALEIPPVPAGTSLPELTDLAGAALLYFLPGQVTANLLPLALRRRAHLRRRRPWLIAAGLLMLGTLLPPWIYYHRMNARLEAGLSLMEEALIPLRARAARNRAGLNELAVLHEQVAQLQSVQERRAAWLQLFADLQERFTKVEDVWLETMQAIPASADMPMKLVISGRMLDKANPLAKVSPETYARVKALLAGIVDSSFVSAVEGERFDHSHPGVLKFDFVLVTDPAHPL